MPLQMLQHRRSLPIAGSPHTPTACMHCILQPCRLRRRKQLLHGTYLPASQPCYTPSCLYRPLLHTCSMHATYMRTWTPSMSMATMIDAAPMLHSYCYAAPAIPSHHLPDSLLGGPPHGPLPASTRHHGLRGAQRPTRASSAQIKQHYITGQTTPSDKALLAWGPSLGALPACLGYLPGSPACLPGVPACLPGFPACLPACQAW
mmetsp:Transcript_11044/g.23832  ORF Transcript_11044/g.23832 Transcript_11044/m.23832 type:complete len:204 (+) Transcript_11044:918-1529(+)